MVLVRLNIFLCMPTIPLNDHCKTLSKRVDYSGITFCARASHSSMIRFLDLQGLQSEIDYASRFWRRMYPE